jgi:hypothetical protein
MVEKSGLLKLHALSPCTVVVKEMRKVFRSHTCIVSMFQKPEV